jgi:hypothetical protein
MGEGGVTGSRGHLSVQFGGRQGSQESSPSGMWSVALEVVSHCPGLQGSSTEPLRNNVGLGLTAVLADPLVIQRPPTRFAREPTARRAVMAAYDDQTLYPLRHALADRIATKPTANFTVGNLEKHRERS